MSLSKPSSFVEVIAGLRDVVDDEDADLVCHESVRFRSRGRRVAGGDGPGAAGRPAVGGRGTGGSFGPVAPGAWSGRRRPQGSVSASCAGRTASTSSGEQDAVVVDEGLEDDAGGAARDGRRARVAGRGSTKSSGERRSTRQIEPSSWANLMTSACWGVTARITICCWPLRVVAAPVAGRRLRVARCWAGGGSSVPEDLDALEQRP